MQQISRDKLDCFLRATTGFTLCVLDRYGLRDHGPARPTLTPQIRFLYIGSRFCSALPSDPASQRRPCASLSLHLYQVVKRTFTSKLSNMRGVPKDAPVFFRREIRIVVEVRGGELDFAREEDHVDWLFYLGAPGRVTGTSRPFHSTLPLAWPR